MRNVYHEDKESSWSNIYHNLDVVLCIVVCVKMYLPATLNVQWLSDNIDYFWNPIVSMELLTFLQEEECR